MTKFLIRNFIVLLSLVVASCAAKDDGQPRIRIVGLNGKSRDLVTKTPELNKQALAAQGVFREQSENLDNQPQDLSQNQTPPTQIQTAQNVVPSYGEEVSEVARQNQKYEQSLQNPEQNPEPTAVAAGKSVPETVEYDLSENEDKNPSSVDESVEKKSSKPSKFKFVSKGVFVQVGSFENEDNAKKTLAKMTKFHKGSIETVEGEKTFYRVLLGPFPNKEKALVLLKKITKSGHEAVLMRKK